MNLGEPNPVFEVNDPEDIFPIFAAAITPPTELDVDDMSVVSLQVDGSFAELTLDTAENFCYDMLAAIYKARVMEGSNG